MVEGLLLQVSLPEVQNLYNVLLDRVSGLHADRCTSPPPAEPTGCSPHMHFNSQGNSHQVRSASLIKSPPLCQSASISAVCAFSLSLFFFKGWRRWLRKESQAASGEGGFRRRKKEGQKAQA